MMQHCHHHDATPLQTTPTFCKDGNNTILLQQHLNNTILSTAIMTTTQASEITTKH